MQRGSGRDKRWSEGEARGVLDEAGRSGLSLYSYAQLHGWAPQRLYWWRDRLAAGVPQPLRFVQLQVAEADVERDRGVASSFEVRFPGGVSVVVAPRFDAHELRRLVAVLGEVDRC